MASVLSAAIMIMVLWVPFGGRMANAALNVSFTFQGHGGVSSDGLGQNTTGNTIQAEVPAGSTVVQAALYGATFFSNTDPTITIDFDGTLVTLTNLGSAHPFLGSYRADVTAQVAAKVGGAAV